MIGVNCVEIPYGMKIFTWNLILRFYSEWQNHKIKILKLDGNLQYIAMTLSIKLDLTFHPNDFEANRKIKLL